MCEEEMVHYKKKLNSAHTYVGADELIVLLINEGTEGLYTILVWDGIAETLYIHGEDDLVRICNLENIKNG